MDDILSDLIVQMYKVNSYSALYELKSKYLGKTGILSKQLKNITSIPVSERKEYGIKCNKLKLEINKLISNKLEILEEDIAIELINKTAADLSLPSRNISNGSEHPISITTNRIISVLNSMGFILATGPDIEDEFHNFTALNTDEYHPARSMHDTFYISKEYLLRTHTSSVQIRYLKKNPCLPVRMASVGSVYRVDMDSTHSPMFHQLEGLWIDEEINFTNMLYVVETIIKSLFGDKIKFRFRPSYFPFTEPSTEIDMSCVFCKDSLDSKCSMCKGTRWLEIAGAGMVSHNVLTACNIDHNKYQGFAFGLGIDRIAMLLFKINNIKLLYENNLLFLEQFS